MSISCGEVKHRNRGFQLIGLQFKGVCRRRCLLDERRVLLRYFIHLRDGLRNLVDAAALLVRCRGNLVHDVRDLLDSVLDVPHRLVDFDGLTRAFLDRRDRRHDEFLDFLCGGSRALREAPHFASDHGETTSLLAGPRGFDSGIQREYVGLECYALDNNWRIQVCTGFAIVDCRGMLEIKSEPVWRRNAKFPDFSNKLPMSRCTSGQPA